MITAYKWHSIARTTTIGASTGIRVEFGESYRILLTTSIDWGNAVISVQNSNLNNTIVASVRLRQNGIHYYLDLKVSQSFSTDFKIELYDNTYWEESSGVSDLAGATLCIIDDINSLNTPSGDSLWIEDENGDLVPKPKDDGSPRGIWTNSFISSGGKNPNTEGGGGFTELIIKFGDVEVNPEGYISVDGVITLPNYPSLDGYLLKDTADNLYQAKGDYATREDINALDRYIKSLFTAEYNENGALISIKANAGLWTNQYLSSGGKNANTGGEGGGVTSFDIMFEGDNVSRYPLENGVITLPAYPTVPDVSGFILKITADELYQPKGNYLTSIPSEYITELELAYVVNSLNTLINTKANQDDFVALADRVSVNEANIATNKTNISNNTDAISILDSKVDAFITKIYKYFTFGNDNIKANYGLWTDSYLSSGGQNSSGGGTGGIDIQAMWDALAASSNEQIHINHIPDLSSRYLKTSDVSDWAKKSSLAASDVPDLSGSYMSINLGGIPMSTTTNLNRVGYGYADGGWLYSGPAIAFGSSNGYTALLQQKAGDYELRVSYKANGTASGSWKTIAFTSDLDGYLSLSGGTLQKNNDNTPLIIKGTTEGAWIAYRDNASEFLGSIGVKSDKKPYFYETSLGAVELIHSGNYASTTDKRYLQLSGGTIDGTTDTPLNIKSTLSVYIGFYSDSGVVGYYGFNGSGTPRVYVGSNGYDVIHSGNVGRQSVSYATSSDKSRRADYIQTVGADGKNWYGDQYMVYGMWNANNTSVLDWKVDNYEVMVSRAQILSNSKCQIAVVVSDNCNVGIGTTSPSYPLDVYNASQGDLLRLQSNVSYACAIYKASSGAQWSVGCNTSSEFYFYNNEAKESVVAIKNGGRITSYGMLFRDTDKPNGYNPTYMSEIYQWQDAIYFTRNNPTTGAFLKSVASINLETGSISSSGASFGGNVYLRDTTGSASTSYKLWFIRRTSTDDYYDYGIYAQTTKGLTFFLSNQGANTDIAWLDSSGNYTSTGNITTRGRFYDSSDIRLKNIISDLSNLSLDTILSIPRVRYQWKKDNSMTMIGTIAQPLIGKFDELLHKDSEGIYSVDYDGIGVIALEGVAKVKGKVDILRERITELEDKVKRLEGTI